MVAPGLQWDLRTGDALFLVDGFVRGTWRFDRRAGVVRAGAFTPLEGGERDAVAAEAEGLRAFLGASAVEWA